MNRRPAQIVISIDLAREEDFRLGPLEICPSRRQITFSGRQQTAQPRVMQVLVALFRADGAVVSREELIESCWDGITVGDDAINRCIAKVRQLAEVGGTEAFAIETVARVGYRLKLREPERAAEPTILSSRETDIRTQPAPGTPLRSRAKPRFWPWIALSGICASLIVIVGVWLLWPVRRWTVIGSRPFIDTLMIERDPAVSPDGRMIAYSAGTDTVPARIYVRPLTGGNSVEISDGTYDDRAPAWASDGVRLAYVDRRSGEPCRIMVTSLTGGPARQAGRCLSADYTTLSWQPNSPFVYYREAVHDTSAIFRLNLDSGARERVTSITDADTDRPRISPDGKWLLFEQFAALTTQSVRLRNLETGAETTLGQIPSDTVDNGTAWTEDSRTVLATISHGLGTEIWAWPIDGAKSYRVYSAATSIERIATGPGGLLAAQVSADRINLARASAAPASAADVIDIANGHSWSPSYAPDGSLAFLSNRSGENAIWITQPNGKPAQLFNGGTAALDRLRWSPDGTKLAFVIGTDAGVTVRVITAEGMPVASFDMPSIGYGMPTWTRDSKALISFDRRIARAVRTDLANPSRHVPVASELWDGVTIRANGTFAIRGERPGIWQIDKSVRLITPDYPAASDAALNFQGDDILIPEFGASGSKTPRLMAQPIAGGAARLFAYTPSAVDDSDVAVDPKSGEAIYAARTVDDMNIDLLTMAQR